MQPTSAPKSKIRQYAVVTCDVVGSRQIDDFRRKRDRKLRRISASHLEKKWILSEYAITAWDEFEGILSSPTEAPAAILDLRRHFHPLELRIGIGIGEVTEPKRKPVNVFAAGEAFLRAREAINHLKGKRNKTGTLTSFVSGQQMFDLIANTIYQLHDSLLESISARQWQTIDVLMQTTAQDRAAKKLRLNKSTVSRNLRRASWRQIEGTQKAMPQIIKAYFPVAF
jgi:hypothetical protein